MHIPSDVKSTYIRIYSIQVVSDYAVYFLLGVDIDCCNGTHKTPLAVACRHDQYECAKLLLENHASLTTKYANANSSPIHIAAHHSSVPCLRLLIENGADVNSVCMGCTPLYEAASADNLPGCKLLLSEGNVYKFHVTKRGKTFDIPPPPYCTSYIVV